MPDQACVYVYVRPSSLMTLAKGEIVKVHVGSEGIKKKNAVRVSIPLSEIVDWTPCDDSPELVWLTRKPIIDSGLP